MIYTNEWKNYGMSLRKKYNDKDLKNKINSIAYKLQNALRTKDKFRFIDTLITYYVFVEESVPQYLTIALEDDDKLRTIGYAFLTGFLWEEKKDNKEDENNEE
jgi:CRISPR-associated protein Cst1